MDSQYREIVQIVAANGYELLDSIGQGGFATVYRVKHVVYNRIFALKVMPMQEDNQCRIQSFLNETESLTKIFHPNIISIYKFFKDEKYFYIVLEYCPGGSLKDLIEKKKTLDKELFISISKQILNAISHLHEKNISHGDIKPANILFDDYYRPKIGDFGMAQYHEDQFFLKSSYMCSPAYASPEVLLRKPYNPFKADMWSFGVMCYHMAMGTLPLQCHCMKDLICLVSVKETWFTRVNYLRPIVNNTLVECPRKRLSAKELLALPLFADDDITKIKKGNSDLSTADVRIALGSANLPANFNNSSQRLYPVPTRLALKRKGNVSRYVSRSVGPPTSTFSDSIVADSQLSQ